MSGSLSYQKREAEVVKMQSEGDALLDGMSQGEQSEYSIRNYVMFSLTRVSEWIWEDTMVSWE